VFDLPLRLAPQAPIIKSSKPSPLTSPGDVNGDGLDDLIIGAYNTDLNDKSNAGESYVVFGKQDTDAINLSSIIGAGGFVIKGEPGSFWSSHLVSSAGDVNGDGLDAVSCLPNTTYDSPAFDLSFKSVL
jgi:hypothetical protein